MYLTIEVKEKEGALQESSPPGEIFLIKPLFSEFEVKKQHFLIVEGLAL